MTRVKGKSTERESLAELDGSGDMEGCYLAPPARGHCRDVLGNGLVRVAVLALAVAFLSGCASAPPSAPRQTSSPPAPRLTPAPEVRGNPESGRRLFTDSRIYPNGCGGCHTLRGVQSASGIFPGAPNLSNVALRPTLGGEAFANTPDNMRRWILDPPSMKPGALMPKLQITEQEAQDLTAFLYSQRVNPPS